MLIVAASLFAPSSLASELEDYIAHVREFRLGGEAEIMVRTVACYQIGQSAITFQPDEASGRYWGSFRSLSCPNPAATPEEQAAWNEKLSTESDKYVLKVHPVVDVDKSGFVTDREAHAFRTAVELGILAAQLEREGELTIETLSEASGNPQDRTRELLAEYQRIRAECDALGLITPQLFGGMPKVALRT